MKFWEPSTSRLGSWSSHSSALRLCRARIGQNWDWKCSSCCYLLRSHLVWTQLHPRWQYFCSLLPFGVLWRNQNQRRLSCLSQSSRQLFELAHCSFWSHQSRQRWTLLQGPSAFGSWFDFCSFRITGERFPRPWRLSWGLSLSRTLWHILRSALCRRLRISSIWSSSPSPQRRTFGWLVWSAHRTVQGSLCIASWAHPRPTSASHPGTWAICPSRPLWAQTLSPAKLIQCFKWAPWFLYCFGQRGCSLSSIPPVWRSFPSAISPFLSN